MTQNELYTKLCNAVETFDEEKAKLVAKEAVEAKIDLSHGIDLMAESLKGIGDKFHTGELSLPHMVLAADAMLAAVHIFEENMPAGEAGRKKLGKIVLGTVEGDVHDIGLNIVAMAFFTSGFEVFNLGKDTPVDKFIDKAQQVDADIIGASVLLSVSMSVQRDLVDEVKSRNLPFKVLVGGGPVSSQWAEKIGADGYAVDAVEGVEVAKKLLGIQS